MGKDKKKENNKSIIVNVFRAGSKGIEVALNGARTVKDALIAAGLQKKETEIINVNNVEIDDMSHVLEHEDRIVLVKNIQGGVI